MVNSKHLFIVLAVSVIPLTTFTSYQVLQELFDSEHSLMDTKLNKVIFLYNLQPLQIRLYEADPKYMLGQALFFDPILSGKRNVSCATCHLLKYGLSDGQPQSKGVQGERLRPVRQSRRDQHIPSRNVLDLWNRDNDAVKSLFWDGRVEALNPEKRSFRSPLGEALPHGFENAMAVQSVFPIASSEEMLGHYGEYSNSSLPEPHRNKVNDLVVSEYYRNEATRIQSVHAQLLERLFGRGDAVEDWQRDYRQAFHNAFPNKNGKSFSIVDLGNAIAHFEELAFAAHDSAWDKYLAGDKRAITDGAKQGGLIFYGKGRCAACHAGTIFSDFDYHGIGIYAKNITQGAVIDDDGRWFATRRTTDRYKFRTPPLRNVTKSAPYFHDGSTPDLESAILRHINPLEAAAHYLPDGSFAMEREQIEAISPVFAQKINLTKGEIQSLISFLSALESQSRDRSQIVPQSVPSGLPIVYQ